MSRVGPREHLILHEALVTPCSGTCCSARHRELIYDVDKQRGHAERLKRDALERVAELETELRLLKNRILPLVELVSEDECCGPDLCSAHPETMVQDLGKCPGCDAVELSLELWPAGD